MFVGLLCKDIGTCRVLVLSDRITRLLDSMLARMVEEFMALIHGFSVTLSAHN